MSPDRTAAARRPHGVAATHRAAPCRATAPARGAATLIVVMVIFFILSLVAAYASRNLIFEQRTSANQYRATQALEAAEAGVEWALSRLNEGRLTNACQPSTSTSDGTFVGRYLAFDDATGVYTPLRYTDASGDLVPRLAGCVRSTTGWRCNCPSSGTPVVTAPTGTEAFPAFRVHLLAVSAAPGQPGVLKIRSSGCTRLLEGCLASPPVAAGDEAAAEITQTVTLARALASPPAAALTARGSVSLSVAPGDPPLQAANVDGITVHAGGTVDEAGLAPRPAAGVPPSASIVRNDAGLQRADEAAFFVSLFGMPADVYRRQPATLRLACDDAADCGAKLVAAVPRNPRRPIWIAGDVDIPAATLGSDTLPVVLVAEGNVSMDPGTRLTGLVYVRAPVWTSAGAGQVKGAVVAEGDVEGDGALEIDHDTAVLQRIVRNQGSWVRVPGGWQDFR